jgi:hypothetical protein
LNLALQKEKAASWALGGLIEAGAGYRIRTDDLPLTRRLLYQLS